MAKGGQFNRQIQYVNNKGFHKRTLSVLAF